MDRCPCRLASQVGLAHRDSTRPNAARARPLARAAILFMPNAMSAKCNLCRAGAAGCACNHPHQCQWPVGPVVLSKGKERTLLSSRSHYYVIIIMYEEFIIIIFYILLLLLLYYIVMMIKSRIPRLSIVVDLQDSTQLDY